MRAAGTPGAAEDRLTAALSVIGMPASGARRRPPCVALRRPSALAGADKPGHRSTRILWRGCRNALWLRARQSTINAPRRCPPLRFVAIVFVANHFLNRFDRRGSLSVIGGYVSVNAKHLLAAASLLFLFGCATTPVPTSAAREVPRMRVLNPALLERKEGLGQVVVKRDEGLSASACNSRVFVNGAPVAEIAPGEKVTFYLPEGEQMLAAMATGICIGGLVEARASVSRSRPAVFRISYGSSGEFSLQPTAF